VCRSSLRDATHSVPTAAPHVSSCAAADAPPAAGIVTAVNVFKVCDQPHPLKVRAILEACVKDDVDGALAGLGELWRLGACRRRL
jgi:hypothetical protein